MTSPVAATRAQTAWYWAGMAAVTAWLLLLLPRVISSGRWGLAAISYPYGLDYGEGIVWEQARMLAEGRGYGEIVRLPAIVYHYPPLYHLVSIVLVRLTGADMLGIGRGLSLVCTVATAALIGVITRRLAGRGANQGASWLCALVATAIYLHFYTVAYWAPLMRVDPLAVFLTVAGLLCGMVSVSRPRLIYVASVLFVAAVYTKQTSIVAPAAVFGTLLFVRPAVAMRGVIAALVLGLALLAFAMALSEGRFLTHIVGYNVNRFGWETLRANLTSLQYQLDMPVLCFGALGALAIVFTLARRASWRQDRDRSACLVMLLAFLALKTISLIMLGKSGASANYLIEWLAPVAIVCGLVLHRCLALLARDNAETTLVRIAALAVPLILFAAELHARAVPALVISDQQRVDGQRLVQSLRGCPNWVIGDDMVAIIRAGKRVVWEPAIFAELAVFGRYDERPVVDAITTGAVCASIVETDPHLIASRYTPAVLTAMQHSQPHKVRIGNYDVYSRDTWKF